MIFDTHKLAKALQPTFTPSQADAITEALSAATLDTVATKTDIAEVLTEIVLVRGQVDGLRADVKTMNAETKASLVQWIVGALAFNFVAVAGLVLTVVKVFEH